MFATEDLACRHWTERLAAAPLPVLRATRSRLERLARDVDSVSAHGLADFLLRDPLMSLRVLVQVAQRLGDHLATPVETVTAALVLGGIDPFFAENRELAAIEDLLVRDREAQAGALAVVRRSHNAARLAAAFAVHRQDADAELLHQAALLHDFAALLLWCAAPQEALKIAMRQKLDRALRSGTAQRDVLGVELDAIARSLMAHWGLPQALRAVIQPEGLHTAGSRTVELAARIARHLDLAGWHSAALPDDFAQAGHLLNMPAQGVAALTREVLE